MLSGVFNINKPEGLTSHDVVARVRRISGERRAGHAGTLDPAATGVLPVVLGSATRLVEYLAESSKAYRAGVLLGATSDTYDREGTITPVAGAQMPPRDRVEAALAAFKGPIRQVPPMHSAIKMGGKKLYELARAGVEVERQPRPVTIYSLQLEEYAPPLAQLWVECSKGTYIRSLAHDLGLALGTGAYLHSLERTRHGPFTLSTAVTLDALQAAFAGGTWAELLHPPEYILQGWIFYEVSAEQERDIMQGKQVALPAPPPGGQEAAAAQSPGGRLLAVLYWNSDTRLWQPRKVFAQSES